MRFVRSSSYYLATCEALENDAVVGGGVSPISKIDSGIQWDQVHHRWGITAAAPRTRAPMALLSISH